jgi:hypothetical protein
MCRRKIDTKILMNGENSLWIKKIALERASYITKKSNLDQLQVSQAQGVSLHGN